MRGFIIFLLVAAAGFVFLRQKHNEPPSVVDKAVAANAAQTKVIPAPLTPAPRGQASEHNWMKRSLDRARDVTEQSRERTQEAQKP
jgi:hypothetical protein